jgi:hypothetical protein
MPCFLLTQPALLLIFFSCYSSVADGSISDSSFCFESLRILMDREEKSAELQDAPELPSAHTLPVLPRILEKYNTEEVVFLDVGPTQNALKGKKLAEIFPAEYTGFNALFGNDRTKLATMYFQLGAGYPEGFKVRMPALKLTRNSYQIGLLEYSMLNPKNTIFRSDSEKEFSNYIPTTLQKVHFLQNRSGPVEPNSYSRVIDTVYEFLFYLTGA